MNKQPQNNYPQNKRLSEDKPSLTASCHPEWLSFFTLVFELKDMLDTRRQEARCQEERFNQDIEEWKVQTQHFLEAQLRSPTLRSWTFPDGKLITGADWLTGSKIAVTH